MKESESNPKRGREGGKGAPFCCLSHCFLLRLYFSLAYHISPPPWHSSVARSPSRLFPPPILPCHHSHPRFIPALPAPLFANSFPVNSEPEIGLSCSSRHRVHVSTEITHMTERWRNRWPYQGLGSPPEQPLHSQTQAGLTNDGMHSDRELRAQEQDWPPPFAATRGDQVRKPVRTNPSPPRLLQDHPPTHKQGLPSADTEGSVQKALHVTPLLR